jgi:hypothetical protein
MSFRLVRLTLGIFCMFACGASAALAQNGISNARDANGNLIRNTGMSPVRSFGQTGVNNLNGPIKSPPAQTPPINSRSNGNPTR